MGTVTSEFLKISFDVQSPVYFCIFIELFYLPGKLCVLLLKKYKIKDKPMFKKFTPFLLFF